MKNGGFDTEEQYKEQLFKELIDIVNELGWNVAVPETSDDLEVPGLIIGTQGYVDSITEALEDAGFKI